MQIISLLDNSNVNIGSLAISEEMARHLRLTGVVTIVKCCNGKSSCAAVGIINKSKGGIFHYSGDRIEIVTDGSDCVRFLPSRAYVDGCVSRAHKALDEHYTSQKATLAVERHGHADWLVATDDNGQNELLAVFVGDEQVDMFTRALALAKASAHAMGQSGI